MSWPRIKFEELYSEPSRNGIYKQKEFYGSGVPIVNMGELFAHDIIADQEMKRLAMTDTEMARSGLSDGDLLFGRRSLVEEGAGKCALVECLAEPTTFESSIIRVRVDEDRIRPRFVYYWLKSHMGRGAIRAIVTGTNVKGIKASTLKNIQVLCPPTEKQDPLIERLRAYDDLIENNRRRIQLLEQAARLLYKEWLVHLRFPGYEHVAIVDGVPSGWKRTTIGDFISRDAIDLQTGPFGTQLKAADYAEAGTPVINVRNIGYGTTRAEKLEFLPEQKVASLSQHILQTGDIVFGRKGAVDRHVLIGPIEDGWVQGSDCIRMRVAARRITPTLLSLAFRQDSHKKWMLSQCGNKATMASLNQDVIARIPLLIPSYEVLLRLDEYASRNLSQITTLQRQSEGAAAARDLLLPRLMNGEIPV